MKFLFMMRIEMSYQNNTEGEIVVKSPAVMKGYCNDEDINKQKITQ